MTLQKVIIRVAGETDLDSTISKLEKLGTVDKKNADSFKATSATAKKSFSEIDTATTTTTKSMGGLGETIGKIGPILAATFSISTIIAFEKSIIDLTAKYDSLEKAIRFSSGTVTEADKNFEFLRQTAEELGLDFLTLTENFKGFSVGAQKAGISAEQTRKIFGEVSTAASAMSLSAADTNGVFLALTQIVSKGTVQAEELRGQIGERIPGAFNIAADAMGVTTRQLNKMLEQGQVLSKDFLPKFAAELQKTFQGALPEATQSLQANINRLGNAFDQLKLSIGKSESDGISGSIKIATRLLQDFTKIVNGEESELDGLAKYLKAVAEPLLKVIQLFSFGSSEGDKLNNSLKIVNGIFIGLEKAIKLVTLPFSFFVDMLILAKDTITGAGFDKLNQDLKEIGHTLTLGFFKDDQKNSVKDAIDAAAKKIQATRDGATQQAILNAQAIKDAKEKAALENELLKKQQAERDKAAKKAEQARKQALSKELEDLDNQNQEIINRLKKQFAEGEIEEKIYEQRLDQIKIEGLEKQKAIYQKYHEDFTNITNQQLDIEVKNHRDKLKEWADDEKYYANLTAKNKQDAQNAEAQSDYEFYKNLSDQDKKSTEERIANRQALEQFTITSLNRISSEIGANNRAKKQAEIVEIEKEEQRQLDALDRRAAAENLTAQQVAAEKKKIQDEAHKEENAIKRKAAQNDKDIALFQVAIGTAQAIVKALPNPYLVALAAATGAIEAALVQSRPIPQFAVGTDNAPGGLSLVGEKGPELVNLPKGSQVFTAEASRNHKGAIEALNKGTFDDYIYKKYVTPAIISDSITDARSKNMAHNIASSMIMQEIDTSGLTQAIKGNKKVKIENLSELAAIMNRSDHFSKYSF